MPIFRVKSVKIYIGQKKFTRAPATNMRYAYLVALNQWQQAAMVTCNNLLQSCAQYFGDKKLLLLHGYLHLGDNCESIDHVTGRF